MNTIIFIAGALLGALAAFVFMFICMIFINHKDSKPQKLDENLVRELWKDYLKENGEDGK